MEKKMTKQYIAEYQHNFYDQGVWKNAAKFPKRYAKTLKEARADLEMAKKHFGTMDKDTSTVCGGMGVTVKGDSDTANAMRIVKTRIRVREVTPWEVVEEEAE